MLPNEFDHLKRCVLPLFLICLSSVLSVPAISQTQPNTPPSIDFTRIYGAEDGDYPIPALTVPLGQLDASALQVVIDFLKTTNIGRWTGMQATGTLTAPTGKSEEQSTATLTLQNGNAFRLDVNAASGQRSTRINGPIGQILESDGKSRQLPQVTALAGPSAFFLLMDPAFPSKESSVVDQGMISVGESTLHRITVERSLSTPQSSMQSNQVSVVDLYFDAASHLLIKSVASVQLDSSDRERYVQVVSYSDYRKVDALLLPHAYSQTLNGQREWSLQLTDMQLTPSRDASYFQF